jgi:hypothetical protein
MKVTGPYFVVRPALVHGFFAVLHDSPVGTGQRVWGTSADSTMRRGWELWGGHVPAVVRL